MARKARAFTLVEILIVVVLLGVLAAIVIPAVANSGASAKASALAQNLRILRRFVLIYKGQHLEVSPGYPGGNTSVAPTEEAFVEQATMASTDGGLVDEPGTSGYNRGPYLMRIPMNPINNLDTVQVLADGADFPTEVDGSIGWIYKPATSEFRAGCAGTDFNGTDYYEY